MQSLLKRAPCPNSFRGNRPWRVLGPLLKVMAAGVVTAMCLAHTAQAAGAQSHQIEELTWTELRDRVSAGSTTVLVPIGGTEQNGPHMVLGKHNVRVRILAGEIARQLGNALVAPVIAYVPEGAIHPPAAHMRFAGTVSISESTFEALLESTARSFKQHGFRDVVFLGDHGSYQKNEERVAVKLDREWAGDPSCRVHALLDYYNVTQNAYVAALRSRGFSDFEIGLHAGLADTSLALAVDQSLVRIEALAGTAKASKRDGVYGDPHRATAELGQLGVQQIVQTSVAAIQALTRAPH
jgi:creatinine amidohydrolase/Fe(II)-dependent formamide hydrolase-like protein